ncbi:hypothetical protein CDL15_Pgr019764 [Punica granatum]|uniref:Uncharacterized protein n=1 Tax=Punica granatum TaxID=22663 RepID=A0A218X6C2_PUNGR|nr:hypothetical protein CDL15_Pgr019764 [Punica granatum]
MRMSLIPKVMLKKRGASQDEKIDVSEFSKQDTALESLISHKMRNVYDMMQLEQLQSGLNNLEVDIHDLEEVFENLQGRLIKSRVSLLNILNH